MTLRVIRVLAPNPSVATLEGTNTLLGLDPGAISNIPALLAEPTKGEIPDNWDGRAGERAADALERLLAEVAV